MLVSAGFTIAAQSAELLCWENGGGGGDDDMARRRGRDQGKMARNNARKGKVHMC